MKLDVTFGGGYMSEMAILFLELVGIVFQRCQLDTLGQFEQGIQHAVVIGSSAMPLASSCLHGRSNELWFSQRF